MSTKKISLGLLIFSLAGCGLGYYLIKMYDCGYSVFCNNLIVRSFGLYYGMGALSIIFIVLIFTPKVFNAWKKFAVWFIPISLPIFIFYSGSGYFDPSPKEVFQWVSILYVLISVFIIVRAARR